MNDDMQLSVEITGDAASAVSAADQTSNAIKGMEGVSGPAIASLTAALDKLNINFDGMGSSATKAAGGVGTLSASTNIAAKEASEFNAVGGNMARAMSSIGIEAGTAAGRVGALGGALDGLKTASGSVVISLAGLAAAFAAFAFLKEGADSAARMQQSMEQLRAVVESNGQSWDTAKGKIQAFFDTESMASGFTRDELSKTLQDLTVRLGDVNAGMEAMRITEELARGTGMSLSESERTLTELMSGRYMALERLDPKIKEMIKDHASTRDILMELHEHYKDAIKDSDDLATMEDREKVAHEKAAEAIGVMMLPALIGLEKTLIGAWQNTQGFAQDWGIIWQGIVMVVQGAASAIKDDITGIVKAMIDLETGHFGAIGGDLNTGGDKGRSMISTGMQIIASGSQALDQRPTAYTAGNDAVYSAINAHDQQLVKDIDQLNNIPSSAASTRGSRAGASGRSGSALKPGQFPSGASSDVVQYDDSIQLTTKDETKFTDALYASGDALGKQILALDKSRQANQERNADERATYGQSTQQQIAYYQQELANLDKFDADYLQKKTELENKIDDLQTKAYEQAVDAQKKAHDQQIQELTQWSQKATGLFNDFFLHGKSGFKDFADAFKQMLEQMLVALEQSALLNLFEKMFGVGGGGFLPSSDVGSGGVSSFGGAPLAPMAIVSQASAQSVASSSGLRSGMSSMVQGSSYPSVYSGQTASSPYDMQSTPSVSAASSGQQSSGGGFLSLLGSFGGGKIPWGAHLGGAGGATLGSFAAAAAGGAMVGQTLFHGQGYADVGGALGAAAALALAGPAGWAAIAAMTLGGAILGGGAGSLFGDHFSQANEPDIYQADSWGQFMADSQGHTTHSGPDGSNKAYNPDSQTTQLTGGKGWNVTMEAFVKKFRGKTQSLPASLRGAFSQIEALWGGADGQANFNTDGKDGYLDLGSGKRALWSDFNTMIQQFGPQVAQLMSNYQNADVFNASGGTATMSGTYSPTGSPNILHDFPDYSGASFTPTPPPAGGGGSGGGGGYGGGGPVGGPGRGPGGGSPPGGSPGGLRNMPMSVTVNLGGVHGNLIHQGDLGNYLSTVIADHMRTSFR